MPRPPHARRFVGGIFLKKDDVFLWRRAGVICLNDIFFQLALSVETTQDGA